MKNIIVGIVCICTIVACKNNKESTPLPESSIKNDIPENVYIVGSRHGAAVLWNNYQEFYLTKTYTNSDAHFIEIVGEDVYIAGTEGGLPVYWKNGIKFPLPLMFLGEASSFLLKLKVEGNEVHVIGNVKHSVNSKDSLVKAYYWKNSLPITLQTTDRPSLAFSMLSHYGVVYVCGEAGEKAVVWRDGIPKILNDHGYTHSIFTHESDIFVAGQERKGYSAIDIFWKNFTSIDKVSFEKVIKSKNYGRDVHEIVMKDYLPYYYKNGTPQTISNTTPSYSPTHVLAKNGKVYFLGSLFGKFGHFSPAFCEDGNCFMFADEEKYVYVNDMQVKD